LAPSDFWFLKFSRNISKKFISHIMKNGSGARMRNSTPRGSKNLFSTGDVKIKGYYVEKCGTETQYTLCAIFCVLFHFDTLSGCKDTNTDALLSKPLIYIHYWLDITLKLHHNPIPLPL